MEAKKFRKKPVEIEAIQWNGQNLREIIDFTGLNPSAANIAWKDLCDLVDRDGLKIFTLEGKMSANIGDWIIKGVKGECYPCKEDIFELTYDDTTTPQKVTDDEIKVEAESEYPSTQVDKISRRTRVPKIAAYIKGASRMRDRLSHLPEGEGWVTEKPDFTEDCWVITGTKEGYEIWEIKRVNDGDGWYMSWLDSYGDEYGDLKDLESEIYFILPQPPNNK